MNREDVPYLLPIIKAWGDGAKVQGKHKTKRGAEWAIHDYPNWSGDYEYRIAPEPAPPRKVPLGPDDFPPGSAVRLADDKARGNAFNMVLSVDPAGVNTQAAFWPFELLMDKHEVYRPGIGWGPGFKMEE